MTSSSFRTTALWSSLVLAILVTGIPLFSELRTLETPAPPPPPVSNSTYVPPSYATNQTALEQACADACFGGECQQSRISGITLCATCPDGYTLHPTTSQCVNTTGCTDWPWCSAARAVLLRQVQESIVSISPNSTEIAEGRSEVSQLEPMLSGTNAELTALFNEYYTARRELVAMGVYAQPTQYWDDENAPSTSLNVYRAMLRPAYASYVTSMKKRMCAGVTWVAAEGTCRPPIGA